MRPRPRFADYMRVHGRELPIMHFCSERLVPRPRDWSPRHVMTGYWELPPDESWQPTAGLLEFLQAGEPPVCLGYLSVGIADPVATTRVALGRSKRGPAWCPPGGVGQPLRRGTTADRALRAVRPAPLALPAREGRRAPRWCRQHLGGSAPGKPTVICPSAPTNPSGPSVCTSWASARRRFPSDATRRSDLGEAIRAAVSDPRMAARASELGEALGHEDGVGNAVRYIEDLVRRPQGHNTVER